MSRPRYALGPEQAQQLDDERQFRTRQRSNDPNIHLHFVSVENFALSAAEKCLGQDALSRKSLGLERLVQVLPSLVARETA